MSENPKTIVGRAKPDATVVPLGASLLVTAALEFGAAKYGAFNWRDRPIPTRTYLAAIRRHLDAYASGEDLADDSRLPHLAHIAAGCLIVLDAHMQHTLMDDRFKEPGFAHLLQDVAQAKASWAAFEAEVEALAREAVAEVDEGIRARQARAQSDAK